LQGRRDLPLAPDVRSGFEMTLLRMLAFRGGGSGAAGEKRQMPARERAPTVRTEVEVSKPPAPPPVMRHSHGVADAPDPPAPSKAQAPRFEGLADWEAWIQRAGLGGPVGLLAQHAMPKSFEGDVLTLALKPEHMIFCSDALCKQLQDKLGEAIDRSLRVRIVHEAVAETPATRAAKARSDEQAAAERALADDPFVQDMQRQFGAQIIPESIRPAGRQA